MGIESIGAYISALEALGYFKNAMFYLVSKEALSKDELALLNYMRQYIQSLQADVDAYEKETGR